MATIALKGVSLPCSRLRRKAIEKAWKCLDLTARSLASEAGQSE